jgi:hypothetical protein
VVFEALCLEEERALIQYVGGTGEVKTEKIEVACPSLLGKVGMMKTIRGRIFVPEVSQGWKTVWRFWTDELLQLTGRWRYACRKYEERHA